MKFFLPLTLAVLLAACATPQEKEVDHQQELEKEARKNFYALKAQEHPNAPPAPTPAPTPAPGLFAFLAPQPAATTSSTTTSRPAKIARQQATPRPRARVPQPDETVYYWQVQSRTAATNPRFQAAEARYARKLAKSPEDLTPEERIWAHEHY